MIADSEGLLDHSARQGALVLHRALNSSRRLARDDVSICGQVYDVTKFLDDHPGGPEVLFQQGGAHMR